jgi:hypothetical protein
MSICLLDWQRDVLYGTLAARCSEFLVFTPISLFAAKDGPDNPLKVVLQGLAASSVSHHSGSEKLPQPSIARYYLSALLVLSWSWFGMRVDISDLAYSDLIQPHLFFVCTWKFLLQSHHSFSSILSPKS